MPVNRIRRGKVFRLPTEVMSHIFVYLPLSDLRDCMFVCRLWRDAANHPKLWRNVCLQLNIPYGRQLPPELLSVLRSRRISHLSISGETDGHVMPSDWSSMESTLLLLVEGLVGCLVELRLNFKRVLPSVSSLEALVNRISSCSLVTLCVDWTCSRCDPAGIQGGFSKLTRLKKLYIPLKSSADLQSLCKSLDHLDCLSVRGLKRGQEDRLKAALPLGKQITSLSLVNCHLEDDDILAINDHMQDQLLTINIRQNHVGNMSMKDICNRQTTLTSLDVSRTDITATGMNAIAKMLTQLTCLCANGCFRADSAQAAVNLNFKKLQHLQDIEISGCQLVHSSKFLPDAPLRNLNLSACTGLRDWRSTSTLSCLYSFDISNCTSFSKKVLAEMMQSLGDYCPSLTSLNVSYLVTVNDEVLLGLDEIPKPTSQLKVASDSMLVQSSSHHSFGQQVNKRSLSTTSLLDCAQDSSVDRFHLKFKSGIVHRLGIMKLTNLRRLCLKGCSRITDRAVANVLQFPLLTELDLSELYLVRYCIMLLYMTDCSSGVQS